MQDLIVCLNLQSFIYSFFAKFFLLKLQLLSLIYACGMNVFQHITVENHLRKSGECLQMLTYLCFSLSGKPLTLHKTFRKQKLNVELQELGLVLALRISSDICLIVSMHWYLFFLGVSCFKFLACKLTCL